MSDTPAFSVPIFLDPTLGDRWLGEMTMLNGYAETRMYDPDDPDGSKARLRRLMAFRTSPWPRIELFPRIARVQRFAREVRWRSRVAASHVRKACRVMRTGAADYDDYDDYDDWWTNDCG